MRPSIIEVDLNILKNNLRLIRQHIDDRPVMAVVKSNAYGHGLVRVAKLYEQLGVNSLGVALPEEGIILRKSGISLPIAVFSGLLMEQIPVLMEWDFSRSYNQTGLLLILVTVISMLMASEDL